MVLIQVVKEKDVDAVFSILLHNGRFSELKGNRFRIDENKENAEETIEKIKKKNIKIKRL